MKILAGSLKDRKLYPRGRKIPARPISAKAKGIVFNVFSPYFFEGFRFLDLFAGTGSLSMEALSRGAAEAHAVENHPLCLKIIRQNASLLAQPKKLISHKKNVFSFLKQTRNFDLMDENQRIGQEDSHQPQGKRKEREQRSRTASSRGALRSVYPKPIEPFDMIVADPPFALKAGDQILTELQETSLTKKGSLIFVETGAGERLKAHYHRLCLFSQKSFSDKKLWFYEQR